MSSNFVSWARFLSDCEREGILIIETEMSFRAVFCYRKGCPVILLSTNAEPDEALASHLWQAYLNRQPAIFSQDRFIEPVAFPPVQPPPRPIRSKPKPIIQQSPLKGYGVAILSVGCAVLLTLLVEAHRSMHFVAPFIPAILIATWYAGLRPGLVAALLSDLAINYFFEPPIHMISLHWDDALRLSLLVLITLSTASVSRLALWRLQQR